VQVLELGIRKAVKVPNYAITDTAAAAIDITKHLDVACLAVGDPVVLVAIPHDQTTHIRCSHRRPLCDCVFANHWSDVATPLLFPLISSVAQ
jgi:hypothetical protein